MTKMMSGQGMVSFAKIWFSETKPRNFLKKFVTVHLEDSVKSADLNTTSIDISLDLGLDDNQFPATDPIDKTMSQISKNQSRADQMIDSCSKIVPEPIETDNNLSTLFTQNADGMSVTELLDLCSGSFVTQATNVSSHSIQATIFELTMSSFLSLGEFCWSWSRSKFPNADRQLFWERIQWRRDWCSEEKVKATEESQHFWWVTGQSFSIW